MCFQPFTAFVVRLVAMSFVPLLASAKLTGQEPRSTDRYGDPLPRGAMMRLGTLRFCQPIPWVLAFSPDGKFLASGGFDHRIRLWDPDTGKDLGALESHTHLVNCIALSADGKWLASGGQDKALLLWEVASRKVLRRFRGHDRPIERLALSPDGKLLASSCQGGTLRLWDTDTGKEIRSLPLDRGYRVLAMKFTPDSKHFAFNNRFDKGIQLVNVDTGKVIRTFKGHTETVYELTFTADGSTLISASSDHTIRVWDVASGKEKRHYGDEKQEVRCLALAPDERTLTYVTSSDSMVHIWDIRTNKELVPPWKAHRGGVHSIAYSPDSKKIALARDSIAIHETASGKRLNPAPESESLVQHVEYAADGKRLAVWRGDSSIELWDTAKWRKAAILRPKSGNFKSMAFSSNGKHLTTVEGRSVQGKTQNIVCRWDSQTGKRQKEYPPQGGWIDVLSFSAAGDTLVCFDASPHDIFHILWDAAAGQERGRITVPRGIGRNPRLSPDGRLMACATSKNAVALWDVKTGKQLRGFGEVRLGFPETFTFSLDGRSIATPEGRGLGELGPMHPDVVLWETATGKERLHIALNEGQVRHLAFSPDGRLVAATAGRSETIHLWNAWTGKEVGQFTGHRGWMNSLAFAPDGRTLASGGADSTVLIWDVSGLLPPPNTEAKKRSGAELAECWNDLARTDAARAYRSMAELARHPEQTGDLLKEKLASHPGMNADRLARLIADLDSDDFQTRESASKELANLGRAAEGALRKTLDGQPSAEVKRRIKNLLEKLDRDEVDPRQIQLIRAVEVLERIGTPEGQRLLAKLAKEAGDANVSHDAQASLQRLGKAWQGVP